MPHLSGYPSRVTIAGRDRPDLGEVYDVNQNVWTLHGQSLVSVPWKSNVTPVTITVIPCKYPVPPEKNTRFPIYLGIKDPQKCLSCEKIGGKPTLQLKDKEILDLYNEPGPVIDFLFYRNQNGRTSTYESVAFPGWFIASSAQGQPLFLTDSPKGSENIAFVYEESNLF